MFLTFYQVKDNHILPYQLDYIQTDIDTHDVLVISHTSPDCRSPITGFPIFVLIPSNSTQIFKQKRDSGRAGHTGHGRLAQSNEENEETANLGPGPPPAHFCYCNC